MQKFLNRRDLIVIAALILAALLGFFALKAANAGKTAVRAVVYYEGRAVRTLGLSGDETFALPQNPEVVFEVKDGKIAFVHSDCPDKVCVNTGWLSSPGDFAACLPNGVSLFVEGDGPDIVAK